MSITANKRDKVYNELCLSEVSSQDIDNDPPLDNEMSSHASSHDSFYQLSLGSPVQKYDDTITTIDVVKIGRRKDRPCSALTIPNVDDIDESVEEEAFSTDKPKDFTLRQSPVKKEEEDNTLNLSTIRCSFFKSISDVQEEGGEPNEESKWVEFNEFEISTETTENSMYTSSEVGGTNTAFPIVFATAQVKSTQTSTMIQSDAGSTKQTENDSLVQQVDELRIRLEALEQLVAAGGIGGGDNPTQVSSDSAFDDDDLDTAFLAEDSVDDTFTITETFTITNDVEENYVSSSNKKRGKVSAFKRMFRFFAK